MLVSNPTSAGVSMQLHLKFALLVTAGLFVTGCGQHNCRLTALSVSPTSATLDHLAAAPGNQGQFFAAAVVSGSCAIPACVNCSGQTWMVSDPINVSISNNGTATCVGATSGAVTVTATAPVAAGSAHVV